MVTGLTASCASASAGTSRAGAIVRVDTSEQVPELAGGLHVHWAPVEAVPGLLPVAGRVEELQEPLPGRHAHQRPVERAEQRVLHHLVVAAPQAAGDVQVG